MVLYLTQLVGKIALKIDNGLRVSTPNLKREANDRGGHGEIWDLLFPTQMKQNWYWYHYMLGR